MQAKFPELDTTALKNQTLVARMFVKENKGRYMNFVDLRDKSKRKYLKLIGGRYIREELFSRADVCSTPIPDFLHVADYITSFMWQSFSAERTGSLMNRTTTLERTGLLDETFESSVF